MPYLVALPDDVHQVVLPELHNPFLVPALDLQQFVGLLHPQFSLPQFEQSFPGQQSLLPIFERINFVKIVRTGLLAQGHVDVEEFEIDIFLFAFDTVFLEGVIF